MQRDVKIGLVIGLGLFILIVIYFAYTGDDSVSEPDVNQIADTSAGPVRRIGKPETRTPLPKHSKPLAMTDPTAAKPKPIIARTGAPKPAGTAVKPLPIIRPETTTLSGSTATTLPVVRVPPGTTPIKRPVAWSTKSTIYVVRRDDITGFSGIAEKRYGDSKYYHLIAKANPGIDSRRLRAGQKINIPPKPTSPAVTAPPTVATPMPAGTRVHIVKSGEGYWKIAEQYYGKGAYWAQIRKANPNLKSTLQPGQKVIIPSLTGANAPAGRPTVPKMAMLAATKTQTYTVKSGDMLSTIAQAKYGSARYYTAIVEANPGIKANNLKVGSKLILPALTDKLKAASLPRAPRPAAVSDADDERPVFE